MHKTIDHRIYGSGYKVCSDEILCTMGRMHTWKLNCLRLLNIPFGYCCNGQESMRTGPIAHLPYERANELYADFLHFIASAVSLIPCCYSINTEYKQIIWICINCTVSLVPLVI